MLTMNVPWWEFIIRAVIVYAFLLVGLRLGGKRQISQLAPFDFVLLLILSNAVQNSMNAGDNSLVGGLISAATLLGLNYVVAVLTSRSRRLEALLDGAPEIIIHRGIVNRAVLRRNKISQAELEAALRGAGAESCEHVKYAILESNGAISILSQEPKNIL